MSRLWVQMGVPSCRRLKCSTVLDVYLFICSVAVGHRGRGPVPDRARGKITGLRPVWVEIVREISSVHLTRATSTHKSFLIPSHLPPVYCTLGKHHPAQKSDCNTASTTSSTHTTTATATCAKASQKSHLAQKNFLSINLSSFLFFFFLFSFF